MTPTLEERLARYAAQLDDATHARPPATTRSGGASRGPGRRVVVAALGVAAAIAIAVVIAVANHRVHGSSIGPATVPTSTVATTPPTHAETSTSSAPTTSTSTTSATTPPPVGTREVVYEPFVGNGIDPRLHVTSHLSGSCFHSRAGGHDYYRCFGDASAGGMILDPCFAGPRGTAQLLVCPTDPTSSDVFELTATSVTENPPSTASRPWAMQLDGGQVCEFASAAWGGLGPYSCPGSNAPPHVADCHEPTRSAAWWSAACQEQLADSSPFSARRVVTVWY